MEQYHWPLAGLRRELGGAATTRVAPSELRPTSISSFWSRGHLKGKDSLKRKGLLERRNRELGVASITQITLHVRAVMFKGIPLLVWNKQVYFGVLLYLES